MLSDENVLKTVPGSLPRSWRWQYVDDNDIGSYEDG